MITTVARFHATLSDSGLVFTEVRLGLSWERCKMGQLYSSLMSRICHNIWKQHFQVCLGKGYPLSCQDEDGEWAEVIL